MWAAGCRDLPIKMLKGPSQCHASSSAIRWFEHRNNVQIRVLLYARWTHQVCPMPADVWKNSGCFQIKYKVELECLFSIQWIQGKVFSWQFIFIKHTTASKLSQQQVTSCHWINPCWAFHQQKLLLVVYDTIWSCIYVFLGKHWKRVDLS